MESVWSELPHWRPILDRSREAVETLARDMRAAESRQAEDASPSSPEAVARPATRKRRRRTRSKKQ